MPYMIAKNDKGEFCVYKHDENHQPVGDTFGCHPTEEEALAQMRAIYVNEHPGKAEMPADARPGPSVKAVGDWELDVLGLPFGSPAQKDAQGEYFAPDTQFHEDKFPLPPAVYYHGWGPDGKPAGDPAFIGKTVSREVRSDGVWYRVVLDKSSELARRVWDAAKRGIARASSGAVAHLVRTDPDGHIRHWPVAELSIFDAEGGRQPANSYAVALPVLKATYQAAGMTLPEGIEAEPEPSVTGAQAKAAAAAAGPVSSIDGAKPAGNPKEQKAKEFTMDEEAKKTIQEAVAAALKAQREADEAAAKAKAEEEKKVKDAIEAAIKAHDEELAVKSRRLPLGAPYVTRFNDQRYDNLDVADMATLVSILTGPVNGVKATRLNDPELAYKSLALKAAEAEKKGNNAAHEGLKALGLKADEIERSTLTSYGDEWAGVLYGTALWDKIRATNDLIGKLPQKEVPQGYESIPIPIEGSDPLFYKVAQAASLPTTEATGRPNATVTSSRVGTPTPVSLTVGKVGARVLFTGEMDEDSIVPWVPQLRAQMERAANEQFEYIILDGDTTATASTNINDIAGTPAATDAFLVLDGLRKLALVTNTANSVSIGTLTPEAFLSILKLMGVAGKNAAVNMQNTEFWIGPQVHWKALQMPEVKTADVAGNIGATIEKGVLTTIFGHKINVTFNMCRAGELLGTVTTDAYKLLSNSAGKVDQDTQANNIYGTILAVRYDQWLMGWKRRMTVETERFADADVSQIVVQARMGLVYRDTEAAAVGYGVIV